MPNLDQIVCTWDGVKGPPGYSTFYVSPAQGPSFQPRLVTFWAAIAPYLHTSIKITVPNSGRTIDDATGDLVNAWTGGTVTTTAGTNTGGWGSVSGPMIRWETGRIADSHRVRGRTFIVPITVNSYSTTGEVAATTITAIKAAADALLPPGGVLVVWHRPKYDHSTKPPTLVRPGTNFPVVSTTVPTKVVYLSRRRD